MLGEVTREALNSFVAVSVEEKRNLRRKNEGHRGRTHDALKTPSQNVDKTSKHFEQADAPILFDQLLGSSHSRRQGKEQVSVE